MSARVRELARYDVFRPTPTPSAPVPLGARSVGHYCSAPGQRDTVMVKHFVQVFWGVRGRGALVIGGIERTLGPQQIAIYFPGMEHRVYALGEPWEYRWWTMDGALAPTVLAGFGLSEAGIYAAGPVPAALFGQLERAIRTVTPLGERRASALAYRLLACAAGAEPVGRQADDRVERALRLIHAEWDRPATCVKALASRLGLHRSVFTRRFRAALGIAPAAYLGKLRMQNALSLLKNTSLPVRVVARRAGFADPNYFARRVAWATGSSPTTFRNQ